MVVYVFYSLYISFRQKTYINTAYSSSWFVVDVPTAPAARPSGDATSVTINTLTLLKIHFISPQ